MDADIRKRLGRLPPKLEILYSEQYDILSRTPGESHQAVLKNVFSLLLCMRRTLRTEEFLAAVSIVPCAPLELISQEQVLEICNNFIIVDTHLNTFRFAHLSVREFLEKQPTYTSFFINAQVTQICLQTLRFSHSISIETKSQFNPWQLDYCKLQRFQSRDRPEHPDFRSSLQFFSRYSAICWMQHCKRAASRTAQPCLSKALLDFFSPIPNTTSAFSAWWTTLENFEGELDRPSRNNDDLRQQMRDCNSGENSVFFLAATFNLLEVIKSYSRLPRNWATLRNASGEGISEVCVRLNSYDIIIFLLEQEDKVQVLDEILRAICTVFTDFWTRHRLMKLLLEQQARMLPVASSYIERIARFLDAGCMAMLLDERGDEVHITEEVVKAAAGNIVHGQKIMELLLERRGDEVQITEEVVKAAAGNRGNAEGLTELLFAKRGNEVRITKELVVAAQKNEQVMLVLLKWRPDEVLPLATLNGFERISNMTLCRFQAQKGWRYFRLKR
ncbi:MAG: hypothetical protein M1822_002750 [Bathelium mastoideum]|nr:MAG: hypothetical protein M1822_002750 [Bathelium mastoideum]